MYFLLKTKWYQMYLRALLLDHGFLHVIYMMLITTIFDKISFNKIWELLLCNAVILLIFMQIPLLGLARLKPSHNAWSLPFTPVLNAGGPCVQETKFGASTLYRGSRGGNYSCTLIFFQQFCQRLKYYLVYHRVTYFKLGRFQSDVFWSYWKWFHHG